MKRVTFKPVLAKLSALAVVCVITLGFSAKAGLDSYEIYLNDRLILQQHVNQSLSLRKLQLHGAKDSDELRIRYKHCTLKGAGTGRSIVMKDTKGNVVKKWDFADVSGSDRGMVLTVKTLRQLEKQHDGQELSLYYTAQELPKGEMLASLSF